VFLRFGFGFGFGFIVVVVTFESMRQQALLMTATT
jgi:hypothetical protein